MATESVSTQTTPQNNLPVQGKVDSVIYELTDEDVPNIIGKEKNVVIMVYADFCGHCKRMAPQFAQASQAYQGCTWARLDAQAFPQSATALGVKSFPTVVQFKDGQRAETVTGYTDAPTLLQKLGAK